LTTNRVEQVWAQKLHRSQPRMEGRTQIDPNFRSVLTVWFGRVVDSTGWVETGRSNCGEVWCGGGGVEEFRFASSRVLKPNNINQQSKNLSFNKKQQHVKENKLRFERHEIKGNGFS